MSEEIRILKIKSCYECKFAYDDGEGLYCCSKKNRIIAILLLTRNLNFPIGVPCPRRRRNR